jgi:hypothetical protein
MFLCLIEHYTVKEYGKVEIYIHAFLNRSAGWISDLESFNHKGRGFEKTR